MSGWIKVHRKVQDHWIFKEQREFSRFEAWLDILLCANHSEQKVIIQGTVYIVKQGESLHSLETWSKRWNWSKSKVKRFFDTLTKELMIVTTNETKTTRVTICNYASYQVERNADDTPTKRTRNADETQTKPNKNEENEKNENNIPTLDEFVAYGIQQLPDVNTEALRLKYSSWVESNWIVTVGGKTRPIKNWKSTLNNTLPYLPKMIIQPIDPLVVEMKRQRQMYGLE